MSVITFRISQDASHGWITVKRQLLNDLGVADKITSYSYQRGNSVYCEEDLDAMVVLNACRAKGIEFVLKDNKFQDRSPIRSYDRYVAQ